MATDGFNGSVVDFASVTLGPLRSINYRQSGARVPVHGSADAAGSFEIGIPEEEVVVGFVGCLPASGADVGDEGALSVVFDDDGTIGTIANVAVSDRNTGGNMDGETLSEITLVPSAA